MAYGWEGSKTRLVPLDKERHLDNALVWLNDPEVTEWVLIGDFPLTRLAEEKFFDRVMGGDEREVAFAIESLEGEHIGFSGIHRIDFRHGTAMTGTIIGSKDHWGKGLGTDAAKTRAKYAFDVLGLRLLMSSVLDGNERSLRMQLAVGYVEIGRIPQRFWKRGAYRDEILTCLTREAFLRES
ncbi:MAG: hypothetical protein DCC46_04585 [Armatimonadetes bacterium]|nr:MAG: hypothetical protein DCC46_04585 [Armatimonadota bacterium]